jgi:outer membrane protein TolC
MPLHRPNRERPAAPAWCQHRISILCTAVAGYLFLSLLPAASAQISLTTAVDLALRNNPRVLGAEDDVRRAQRQVDEAIDVYIPAINLGANFGQAYGYLPNPPTFFEVTAGSLAYSASQHDYIRSARAGVSAAEFSRDDVREAVAQDTALAFIALDNDEKHEQAIRQQDGFAHTLVTIEQERVDAGQDTQIDLTQARLTAAQLHLSLLRVEDNIEVDRDHLARLIGLPSTSLSIDPTFPTGKLPIDESDTAGSSYANAGVASAFSSAQAKQLQAKADSTFRFKPQINFIVNYQRYATFTDSFKNLENIYKGNNGQTLLTSNETAFGVQITLPFFDQGRSAKAHETEAIAARALHDARNAQLEALDSQGRLRHSIAELQAQRDVAQLRQQLAQHDVLQVQLQAGTGDPNGPQMSPKDEQNQRIAERDEFLAFLDAEFQLRQNEIQLLRQSGELESWLKSALQAAPAAASQNSLPPAPTPQPAVHP